MIALAFQASLLRMINEEPKKEDLVFWSEFVELKNTVSSSDNPATLLETSQKYSEYLRRAIGIRSELDQLAMSAFEGKDKLEILTILHAMRTMRIKPTGSQFSILCDLAKTAEDDLQIPIMEYLLDSSKAIDCIPLLQSFCEDSSPAVRLFAARVICKNAISNMSDSIDKVFLKGGSFTEYLSSDFAVDHHVCEEVLLACGDNHFSTETLLRESNRLLDQDTSRSLTLAACYHICNVETTNFANACRTLALIQAKA